MMEAPMDLVRYVMSMPIELFVKNYQKLNIFITKEKMNKQELTFLVDWGDNKETAWSGTNYSLYKALSKYYDIKDINLNRNRLVKSFMRRILRLDETSIDFYNRHLLGKELHKVRGNTFQFSEVLYDRQCRNTYMYIDLTVSYINHLRKENPDIFAVSAFQDANMNVFEKRGKEQDSYIRTCSGLFTMGHWLKEWLVKQGFDSNHIYAVGGGTNVNVNLIMPQPKTHNKILFIGKDFKRKGGYITYEAFKLLRQQGEEVELFVIGPVTNPIDNPIDGFHFVGQIPYEEEAKYYNMCDVFCMPSYFEAYGLVFIEALTFGLPCIGRNCYEMPYFIQDGETGFLLNNDDPNELATLIHRTLNEESFSKNVLSRRQQYIKDYFWDTVANRIYKVIGK